MNGCPRIWKRTVRTDPSGIPAAAEAAFPSWASRPATERARLMTDAEVEALLDTTNGILALENMEHADDLMLELAGICSRDRVTVGGVVDTRNAKKPLSTNVQVTGRTFEGKISTHTFTLGDETSMAANVCGPAFGYLKTGVSLQRRGQFGLFTAAEIMPQFVR